METSLDFKAPRHTRGGMGKPGILCLELTLSPQTAKVSASIASVQKAVAGFSGAHG